MSKKLAGGADAIVLDVKTGSGAFMPTVAAARELAQIMVEIGEDAGRKMAALISDMNQPLGHAVGNALEVKEAIAALHGGGPDDLWAHCLAVAARMLCLAGTAATVAAAQDQVREARDSGRAFVKFRQMVATQGGDVDQVDHPDRLPQATHQSAVEAPRPGYVATLDTGALGWAAVYLGAGRQKKGDAIDHAVGFVMPVKVGDYVAAGADLAIVHARREADLAEARAAILAAITWSEEPVAPLPHVYDVLEQA
jgi:pyrimidine-nucleoside phosphorylase